MSKGFANSAATMLCAIGLQAVAAHAQMPAIEWSSVAKITNGQCGGGLVIAMVERPGLLTWKPAGQSVAREIPLAPDGSAKVAYKSDTFGQMTIEVPAGKGKRPLVAKQVNGICQWVWS